jgi:hypothetical protein
MYKKEKSIIEKVFDVRVKPPREAAVNVDGTQRDDPFQKLKDMLTHTNRWGKYIKLVLLFDRRAPHSFLLLFDADAWCQSLSPRSRLW